MPYVNAQRLKGLLGVAGIALALLAGGASRSRAAEAALTPTPVKASAADEYAPAEDGLWFSWTESSHDHPNRYSVYVRRGSGAKIRVNARGTHGAGGGIDGGILVYYEHRGNYAGDIRKFNLRTHRRSNFPSRVSSRWDEYHPTISGTGFSSRVTTRAPGRLMCSSTTRAASRCERSALTVAVIGSCTRARSRATSQRGGAFARAGRTSTCIASRRRRRRRSRVRSSHSTTRS